MRAKHMLMCLDYALRIIHVCTVHVDVEEESEAQKLWSVLSQLEYTFTVRQYDTKGMPFCTHLHVPGVNQITGEVFCEKEKIQLMCLRYVKIFILLHCLYILHNNYSEDCQLHQKWWP